MSVLALRNLFHDKVRLIVTLTGIVFAVVLIAIQVGLFLGFATTTSTVIDHTAADLWIVPRGVTNIDRGGKLSERKLYRALGTPGVAWADKYIVDFSRWQRPDGGEEPVEIVGFNPERGIGGPWHVVAGDPADLRRPDTVFVDRFYLRKLGVTRLGETVEIRGHRARVVGFTEGIRSFTTSPYVFTSFKNALNYMRLREDETAYILVKADAGVPPAELKRRLAERLPDVEIYTTAEFSRKTQIFWMFGTGAGVSVLIAALLGLIVGIVVVSQTTYAMTMDHLREFGTLKAMGATNGYIYRVIIEQAVISAVMGYSVGITISLALAAASRHGSALILLPWPVSLAMLALAVGMCVLASLASIRKVTTLDPVMVFKQ